MSNKPLASPSMVPADSILLTPKTTAERDADSLIEGHIIFNSDTKTLQVYDGTNWKNVTFT